MRRWRSTEWWWFGGINEFEMRTWPCFRCFLYPLKYYPTLVYLCLSLSEDKLRFAGQAVDYLRHGPGISCGLEPRGGSKSSSHGACVREKLKHVRLVPCSQQQREFVMRRGLTYT